MCIPNNQEIREKLLAEAHDTQLSGHLGVNKTVAQLRRRFWWPAMAESVADYIRTCGLCQVNKPSSKRKLGLLQPLEIPERRWGSVSMDQIVELPKTNDGFDSIVVYVDRLTKMMHCQPTHTNVTAPVLAHIFFDTVVRLHGLPDDIVSDRDPKFTGHFWRALIQARRCEAQHVDCFHPQTMGRPNVTIVPSNPFFGISSARISIIGTHCCQQLSSATIIRSPEVHSRDSFLLELWHASCDSLRPDYRRSN